MTTTLALTAQDFREALTALEEKRTRLHKLLPSLRAKGDARTKEANRLAIEEAEATLEDLEATIFNFKAAVEAMA